MPEAGAADFPDFNQYSTREAVARLFEPKSPQNLDSELINLDPSQTPSPQVAEFISKEDVLFPTGQTELATESQTHQPGSVVPASCHTSASPIWNANAIPIIAEKRSGQSSLYSRNPPDPNAYKIINSTKSQETIENIPKTSKKETFSYTDSDYFRFAEPSTVPGHIERATKQSTSSDEHYDSGSPNIGEHMEIEDVKSGRRGPPSSAKVLIGVLCLSLVISLYFALFGSPVSFRNFFNSLTDERKEEVANELRLKYMSSPESAEVTVSKDPRQPKPFSGIVYSPNGSLEPLCGYSKEDAIRDMALVSTISKRVRTYGVQCKQVDHMLYAIKVLKLDTKLAMGIWLNKSKRRNEKQMREARTLMLNNDITPIEAIYVGTEVLRREDLTVDELLSYVEDMRTFISAIGLEIPVGTSESLRHVSSEVVDACDVVGFNIQPFLAGVSSADAAQWSLDQFSEAQNRFSNGKTKFTITEIGWPYQGGHFKTAQASPSDYKEFMHTWVNDKSKTISNEWYFFEAFNEPWKLRFNTKPESWEAEWGIFDDEKKLRQGVAFSDQR